MVPWSAKYRLSHPAFLLKSIFITLFLIYFISRKPVTSFDFSNLSLSCFLSLSTSAKQNQTGPELTIIENSSLASNSISSSSSSAYSITKSANSSLSFNSKTIWSLLPYVFRISLSLKAKNFSYTSLKITLFISSSRENG